MCLKFFISIFCRDEKVRNKIFRILKIWEQRQIYSEEYLSDLNGLLSMNPVKKTQQSSIESGDDFQVLNYFFFL